eukprot:390097_1
MNQTEKSTAVAIELGKEDTEYNEDVSNVSEAKKKNHKHNKGKRCKRFVTQTMTMFSRFASLFDLITDAILLYKASSRKVLELTLILSLSIISPYVLSYSSGIKLFIYRKTFDNLVGFRNLFLILYLLPTGFLYFVLLDLIDILLSIWIWVLHNVLCRQEQYLKELQEIIAKDLGMDRMSFEGFKIQKSISQILFETIPQVTLQLLLIFDVIPGKELAGITSLELRISIACAVFNFIIQISKLYIESVAVNERFVVYCLNAMMGRVSWVPFRLKVVKLARHLAYTHENEYQVQKSRKRNRELTTCCSKLFSVYWSDPNDDDYTINYNIKYRIPLISHLSHNEILSNVDYDFSVVTIGHLIATINQLQTTTALPHDAHISIKFHESLKLLGIKEIVNLMEVCKRKNILLPDIAQCVDWTHSFSISSTIHENDPRLATYCRDYNDRPLLISMYKTKYDVHNYSILNSFLDNDCPMSLKDSNNETIVYHMVRCSDFKALRILFDKHKQHNLETNNLNIYNKAGISPLCLALKCDVVKSSARINPKVRKSDTEKKDNDVDEEAEEVPRSEQKDERKQEEYAADDEAEWHTRVIGMCIAQKYEYNTACNIIRCKLNCILMERLASAQRHHKLIHWMYECLYECKQAQNNKTMKNVHSFLSKCTNPKIAQFAKRFKANNDLEALSTSMQNLLHEDYADIADFGHGGTMSHYFSALMDHYTHGGVQDIIKQIKRDELALMDGKVNKYMKNYPFREESEDNADRSEKIKPRSQWMHRMLLDNGADVNFPCLNGDNDNQVVISPLGICLTQFFDSLDHLDIIQDLLNRQAKLTQAEIPMLSELFVKASSQKEDAIDMYCDILENIAKNSNVLLQNVTDLDHNNPIHTAVIHHHAFNQNKDTRDTREDARQARIISQLCSRYPFWIKQRNIAGDYPLYLAVKYRDVASIFSLLSFLSANDYDVMNRMIQQRVFVSSLIAWVLDALPKSIDDPSCDIQIAKIFLELYGYEAIFCWPNPLSVSPHVQAPITLMDLNETKDATQRTAIMDILIKKCNLHKYVQDKHLIEIKIAPHTVEDNEEEYEYEIPKEQPMEDNPNEKQKQKQISGFGFDINALDKEDQNENKETDQKELEEEEDDAENELEDDEEDTDTEPPEDEVEAVNWIELFYSTLVESFSTADLYTD